VQLLVWIIRHARGHADLQFGRVLLNGAIRQAKYAELRRDVLRGALDLAGLDTSIVSIFLLSSSRSDMIPTSATERSGGSWLRSSPAEPWPRGHPELVKVSLPPSSGHVQEVVTSAKEGGASWESSGTCGW